MQPRTLQTPPTSSQTPVQKEETPSSRRAALRGQDFASQERALSPDSAPVQMRVWEDPRFSEEPAKPSDAFSAGYRDDSGKVAATNGGQDYDSYLRGLGPIKASSEYANDTQRKYVISARTMTTELTGDDLVEICDPKFLPPEANAGPQSEDDKKELAALTPDLNNAFRIMKLDTVGAQAAYLANAVMESSSFRYFTETQFVHDKAYRKDGGAVLDTGDLDRRQKGTGGTVGGLDASSAYRAGGSIDRSKEGDTATDEEGKQAHWNEAFIGRGPLQVTHNYGYASTIAILEKRQWELEDEKRQAPADQPNAQLDADLALVTEAVEKIKADPAEAANRKYAYLFSAAYEKMPHNAQGDTMDKAATIYGTPTSGMGPQGSIGPVKQAIYGRAMTVLQKRLDIQAKAKAEEDKKAADEEKAQGEG